MGELGRGEQAGFLEEVVQLGGPTHLLGDPERIFDPAGPWALFVRGGGWHKPRPGIPGVDPGRPGEPTPRGPWGGLKQTTPDGNARTVDTASCSPRRSRCTVNLELVVLGGRRQVHEIPTLESSRSCTLV